MKIVAPVVSRVLAVLYVGALLASCGESTAPPALDPELDEALEQMTDAEALAAPGIAMMGGTAPPVPGDHGLCPYNSGNQRFVCPAFTASGVTINRYYQLLDASGGPQSAWGTNVVGIRNVVDMSGTLSGAGTPPNSMQITSHDESTLSGIRSATRTLTGTGTSTFTVTLTGGSPSVISMTRTTNLTLPEPGPASYPTGTISMTSSLQGSSVTNTMTITYNGTSTATLTRNFGGITQTCTLNLATPQTPPLCT